MKNPKKSLLCTVLAMLMIASCSSVMSGCTSNSDTNSQPSEVSKVESRSGKTSQSATEESTDIDYYWTQSELLKDKIPKPDCETIDVQFDTERNFTFTVNDISEEQFRSYINECMELGYKVDYSRDDTYYSALDSEGYSVIVYYYEDERSMDCDFYAPKEESSKEESSEEESGKEESVIEESSKQESSKAESSTDSGIVTPSFKEAMDSYEEFFDEYVAFMKKYSESDDTLSMLNDYTQYMTQYTETMNKMNEINEDELSDADLAYYIEVQARISQKLLEAA